MWRRRDGEEGQDDSKLGLQAQPAAQSTPQPHARPAGPSPQAAPKSRAPKAPPSSSRIGETVSFSGEIDAGEDLRIDGRVEGKVTVPEHLLLVGPNSVVRAEVHARSLILEGRLHGKVKVTEKAEIKHRGHLEGDLVASRLVIEDGAIFRGTSEMPTAEPAKPSSPPEPPSPEKDLTVQPAPAPAAAAPAPAPPAKG